MTEYQGNNDGVKEAQNRFFQKNFGILITAMISLAAVLVSASNVWVAHINNEKAIQLNTIQRAREVISQSAQQLGARKDEDIDLQSRLAGITSLSLLTIDKPPAQYYEAAVDLLITYIRTNLSKRKGQGIGIVEDRGTFRAEDIVAALNALQKIRKASNETASVKLTNLDFSNSNLVDLDLSGFNFTHSKFTQAFLSRANMQNTKLLHTKFEGATFWNTDFRGADFTRAVFHDASFNGVILNDTNIELGTIFESSVWVS